MTSLEPRNEVTLHKLTFLLNLLDPIRGPRAQSFPGLTDKGLDQTGIRRLFVEAIAYSCANDKGPDHVIAAALQQNSTAVTLWLAGNSTVSNEVEQFLEQLLSKLRETVQTRNSQMDDSKAKLGYVDEILSDIINFQEPRTRVYYNQGSYYWFGRLKETNCSLDSSETFDTSHILALRDWLEQKFPDGECHFPGGTQLEPFIRDCYSFKQSIHADTLCRLSQQGSENFPDFQRLQKLIGKIGKQVTVAQVLVNAAIKLPELKRKLPVSIISRPKSKKGISKLKDISLESILKEIFPSESERARYIKRLEFLSRSDDNSESLKEAQTFVHAELFLLEHFFRNKFKFPQGDKYIGCSKPACYLCHAYIENHPGGFLVPPCHNKLYRKWRTPDVDTKNSKGLEIMENITACLISKAREDLHAELDSTAPRKLLHPDSPA